MLLKAKFRGKKVKFEDVVFQDGKVVLKISNNKNSSISGTIFFPITYSSVILEERPFLNVPTNRFAFFSHLSEALKEEEERGEENNVLLY